MLNIIDKRLCTGCGACVNACPKHIIRLCDDREGFLYPVVDHEKCINCNLCEKSCPMQKEVVHTTETDKKYPQFYAGQLRCKDDLWDVSSGGAFWAFAETIIDNGGIVYGAVQENVDIITHIRAEDIEGIKRMRRSKYFQSDTCQTFRKVKEDLGNGKLVLYSGTGCQIAGLTSFLGRSFNNLYTCEVVCHGVPSRKVWKAYRKEKEEHEGKRIIDLVFRDKTIGWSRNQYKITYQDGSIERERSIRQLFHAGYLSGLFYRPSCGCCRFASLPRVSDITLADYWKYKGRFLQLASDLGVSLITINSNKGYDLLSKSSNYLDYEDTERGLALDSCRHLDEYPIENPDREAFFKLFFEKGYFAAAQKYIVFTEKRTITHRLKGLIKRLFKLVNNYR